MVGTLSGIAEAARAAVPGFVSLKPEDLAESELAIRGYEPGDRIGDDGLIVCGVCGKPKEVWCESPYEDDEQKSSESSLDCSVRRFLTPMVHLNCNAPKDASYDAERRLRIKQDSFGKWFNRYRDASLYALEPGRPETDAANSFVRNFPAVMERGAKLMLYGPKGTGKTYTAAAICNELMPRRRVRITSLVEMDRELRSDMDGAVDRVRRLCAMDLVVLDDLGAERDTSSAMETATWIVDSLYSSKVPLVITTNMTLQEIASPRSDMGRIMDRLKETCKLVEVSGPNKRQSGA